MPYSRSTPRCLLAKALPAGIEHRKPATASDVSNDGAIAVWIVYGAYGSGFWTGQHAMGLQVFGPWSLLNDG